MKINDKHKLIATEAYERIRHVPISNDFATGGKLMRIRRISVIHFTAGGTGMSSLGWWRNPKCLRYDIGAHFIIERDGEIIQVRACDRTISHAGISRWIDPKTNIRYPLCNQYAIGIELANAGNDCDNVSGEEKIIGFAGYDRAKHKNGGKIEVWEKYSNSQIESCIRLNKALCERYNLDDIVGHEDIAPERKTDPGPLFPMQRIREHCGFKGLPVVHWK